jgi:hypothetical protein
VASARSCAEQRERATPIRSKSGALDLSKKLPAGATAVVLNVPATGPASAGFVTAFPVGTTTPVASNLDFARGQTVANQVTLGGGAVVDVYNASGGSVQVVADEQGYYINQPSHWDG